MNPSPALKWPPGHLYRFHFTLRSVFDCARKPARRLIILPGNSRQLWVSGLILNAAGDMLERDDVTVHRLLAGLPGSHHRGHEFSGSVALFSELREQDDIEHSAKMAERYINSGATVIASVFGTSYEVIRLRLLKLGMSENILDEHLTVIDADR